MKPFLPIALMLLLSACGGRAENNTASMETAGMETAGMEAVVWRAEAGVWRADASHMDDPREVLKANRNIEAQAIFYDRREKVVYLIGKKIAGFDFRKLSPLEAEIAHPIVRHFLQCFPKGDCSSNEEMQTCQFTYELRSKSLFERDDDPLGQVFSLMMARGYLFSDVQIASAGNHKSTITFAYAEYHDECSYLEADVRKYLPHLVGKRILASDPDIEEYAYIPE